MSREQAAGEAQDKEVAEAEREAEEEAAEKRRKRDYPEWNDIRVLSRWVRENPVTALTIGGVSVYGALRLSQAIFYGGLGFTPEEAGLGYANTIARAIYGLIFVAIVYMLARLVAPILVWVPGVARRLWFLRRNDVEKAQRIKSDTHKAFSRAWKSIRSEFVSSVIFLAFVFWPIMWSWMTVGAVRDGQAEVPGVLNGYMWTADPALVHPLTSDSPFKEGQGVLYLGQGGGLWAIYDPATHSSWRVPVSELTIQTGGPLNGVKQVPQDCPTHHS